ncbi:hypothetical protein MVEN_00390000 [Mycena venus]|uniref:RNase III domain-containing protein n=1 Tax=Mycena venus TaxID=2733690 RepID=A0A8H7D7J5_9AGAR|nr:hypothetical protein MVEN_00390000 [Mycena venus]
MYLRPVLEAHPGVEHLSRLRETPLQLIAYKLSRDNPLRNPVPERNRLASHCFSVPIISPEYPSDLPAFTDVALLCTVFSSTQNKRLEWLGDAIVDVAITDSLHRHVSDPNARITNEVANLLWEENFLGHFALLYGLQLHCPVHAAKSRRTIPSAGRMCDVFEAFVGAACLEFGGVRVLTWLADLFDPWVATLCASGLGVASSDVTSTIQSQYRWFSRAINDVPAVLLPLSWPGEDVGAMNAFGPPRVGLWAAQMGCARTLLDSAPRDWPPLDSTLVYLRDDYPPFPPEFHAKDAPALTAALTHVFCRLRFGPDVHFDQRYKWLGLHLCKAAITAIATEKLSSASAAELDDVRIECTNSALLARLGLLFGLNKYICRIRRADEQELPLLQLTQLERTFCAFVGVVYTQFGWAELLDWLDPLFWPWIQSAWEGRLRASKFAESRRQGRRRQQVVSEQAKIRRVRKMKIN